MRPIKFRAWFIEEKRMYPVSFMSFWTDKNGENFSIDVGVKYDEGDPVHEDPNPEHILMQFTGLLDKNGKEIYEGDIVNIETLEDYFPNIVIKWDAETLNLCPSWVSHHLNIYWKYEVIGNIWENGELLGDSKRA